MRRSASAYGNGVSSKPLRMLKIEAAAPMPSASVRMLASENSRLWIKVRTP